MMKTRQLILSCLCVFPLTVLLVSEEILALRTSCNIPKKTGSRSSASRFSYRPDVASSTISSYLDYGTRIQSDPVRAAAERDQERDAAIRKRTAPLVDSSLLRFVATAKQPTSNANCETRQLQNTDDTSLSTARAYSLLGVPSTSSFYLYTISNYNRQDDIRAQTNPDESTIDRAEVDQGHAFDGVERKVISLLLDAGADSETAANAGRSIHNYAQDITRRKSIRWFLRKRDSLWANPMFGSSVSTLATGKTEDVNCDIECVSNVVSVLVNAGLNGKDCASIFAHTPSLAFRSTDLISPEGGVDSEKETNLKRKGRTETVEVSLNRALNGVLCGTLQLRRYDARKVLRACPGLLTVKGSLGAEQVVGLLSKLGVSNTSLARDKSALPQLLSRPPSLMFRLVAFLSCDMIRMPVSRVGPLLRRSECIELLNVVAPTTIFNAGTISKVNFNRDLDNVYREIRLAAKYLRDDVGVEDMAKVVAAYPDVLLLNMTSQIYPVVEYLCKDIGMDRESVSRTVQTFPHLLGTRVDKMNETVAYLNSLEISTESLRKMIRAFPSILSLDLHTNMLPVVEFLKEIGVVNIGRFITRLPPVLGYSVEEELRPKWRFLTSVCDFGYFEVVRFPAYFSYPLDKVIVPRYEYLKARSIPFQVVTIDEVLRYGDSDFARIVVGDRDGGALFSRFLEERRERRTMNNTGQRNSVTNTRKLGNSSSKSLQPNNDEESQRAQQVNGQSSGAHIIITGKQMI